MRDRTYQLFKRCYLATIGLVIGAIAAGFVMVQIYITVNDIQQWHWISVTIAGLLALAMIGISLFGKEETVTKWVDPFGTGDLFEFLVIGIAFPLFGIVWLIRKLCFWKKAY